jgi:hypothetical protein
MTLAQVFRRPTAVQAAGTARVVVRWDHETGWAHLAVAAPGADRARFVGFHRFADGGADTVVAELAAAGCGTASEPRRDAEFMAIEAVLAPRGVASDAAR